MERKDDFINSWEYQSFLDMTSIYTKDDGYYKMFYSNDYPIPFVKEIEEENHDLEQDLQKNEPHNLKEKIKKTIYFYPIKVSQYELFANMCDVLVMDEDKMQGSDYTTITMTYLDYLLYKANKKDGNDGNHALLYILFKLLSLVLRIDISLIDMYIIDGTLYLQIDGVNYDAKDFDLMRKIICDQNCIEIPDVTIHPDIKRKIREAEVFRNKRRKNRQCSFEDMKSRVSGRTGFTCREINQMTIREFSKLLESLEIISAYDLETLLSPNMDKKDQIKIKHWLSEIPKVDKFKEYTIETSDVSTKLSGKNPNA